MYVIIIYQAPYGVYPEDAFLSGVRGRPVSVRAVELLPYTPQPRSFTIINSAVYIHIIYTYILYMYTLHILLSSI